MPIRLRRAYFLPRADMVTVSLSTTVYLLTLRRYVNAWANACNPGECASGPDVSVHPLVIAWWARTRRAGAFAPEYAG